MTSVINRFDPVPHLSLEAALRMVLGAERLADKLSWQQTLALVVAQEASEPHFEKLMAKIPKQPGRLGARNLRIILSCEQNKYAYISVSQVNFCGGFHKYKLQEEACPLYIYIYVWSSALSDAWIRAPHGDEKAYA